MASARIHCPSGVWSLSFGVLSQKIFKTKFHSAIHSAAAARCAAMAISDITNEDNDGSARSDAAQKRARDAIDHTEDARSEKKKVASTAPSDDDGWELSREFICSINRGLPIEPVTAEDGKVYERADIERWFKTKEGDPTSPMTNEVIGTELIPAPQIRKAIEAHVESGAIKGKIAEAWKWKLADEKEVKETRAKAESGDGEAMDLLGLWYQAGSRGLAEDAVQARAWYERSAAARDPKGMSAFAECLLNGDGGPRNISLGLDMVRRAAALGSDVASLTLGKVFFRGSFGLPKDPVQARFWLKKVGERQDQQLWDKWKDDAAELLRKLDQEE